MRKQLKIRSLKEIYDACDKIMKRKDSTESKLKLDKHLPTEDIGTKVKSVATNECADLQPTLKNGSSKLSLKSGADADRNLDGRMWKLSNDSASLSLSPDAIKGKGSFNACVNKNIEELQNIDGSRIVLANKVLNCRQDDLLLISKAEASKTLVYEHVSMTVQKNVPCSSSSVNNVLPERLKSSVQSDKHCSINGQSALEEGNAGSSRQIQCSEKAVHLIADTSNKSDQSKTSSLREKTAAAAIQTVQSFEFFKNQGASLPARLVSSVDAHICKCNAGSCDDNPLKGNVSAAAAADDNQPALYAKSCFDDKEHSTLNVPLDVPDHGSLYLQCPLVKETGGSGQPVEVRVCNICGDVGHEAFLAICSNCNDSAEHIYCMKVKIDEVPEGHWRCEECSMMQEIQKEKFTGVKKSAGSFKPSAEKMVQESGKKIFSTFRSLCKGLGPNLKYRPSEKIRALEKKGQLTKLSGFRRTVVPQVLSWKDMEKGRYGACPVSSSDDHSTRKVAKACSPLGTKSSKVEMNFPRRSLSMIKPFKSSDMKFQMLGIDIQEKRKIAEVTATCRNKEQPIFTKLSKYMPLNGIDKACSDVSNSKAKINEESKYLRHKNDQKIIQRSYSVKNDRPKTCQPLGHCSDAKLSINPRTAISGKFLSSPSLMNKGHDGKASKVPRSLNMSNPNHEKAAAKHVEEKRQPSSQDGGRSPCQAKTVVSSHGLNRSQITRRDDNGYSGCTDNVLQDCLPTMRDLPIFYSRKDAFPGASVFPKLEYIWKGLFKLEEGRKLPSHSYRMQAHLSTSASPRVSDAVHKFSHDLLLKYCPRMDCWPVRFQKPCPKEEDIALYFFAEDLNSFRDYKTMLECMVQNDMALKANFDGVELLLLPSNLLPQGSQHWNGFSFLWGVFRGRKATCPDYLSFSGPQETRQVTNSCDVYIGRDSSIPRVSRLQHMSSPVPMDGGHYPACGLAKPNQERDMTSLLKLHGFHFHGVPSASNSSRSEQLPGGMQHANDFQDKRRELNHEPETAFGGETGQVSKEVAYIPDSVGGCKGNAGHSNGNDGGDVLFGGAKTVCDTGFPWMKAPAPGQTFLEETKHSAYNMNATESSQTVKGSFTVVAGVSGLCNSGGRPGTKEWQVELRESDATSKIPDLNLGLEDQMEDEQPNGLDFSLLSSSEL